MSSLFKQKHYLADKNTTIATLMFLTEIGETNTLDSNPVNRFEVSDRTASHPTSAQITDPAHRAYSDSKTGLSHKAPTHTGPALSSPLLSSDPLLQDITSLSDLKQRIEDFDQCALKASACTTVFATGDPKARVMLIGEGPGKEEDRQGLPFVGVSGLLLDKILASIGLDRTRVYITNIVPWRPPGNRTPSTDEIALMLPFVKRHIELVAPDIIVPLGGVSAKALLGTTEGITRLRGRWAYTDTAQGRFQVFPTYHPAYLLRTPTAKRHAWLDWLEIAHFLGQQPPTGS